MNKLADALLKVWPSCDLPGYRDHVQIFATYSGFSYEDLPPVEADNQFRWLEGEPTKEEWSLRDADGEIERRLRGIEASAKFNLPAPFVAFLRSPELQARVRSCTACYLELPDYAVPTFGAEEGCLIHFLSDQQWCLHWSLHINPAGEECVICSEDAYGFDFGKTEENGGEPQPPDAINPAEEEVAFCAPSFSEFLYRFWMENELWFALTDEAPLTAEQQAYVNHYDKQR